MVQETLGHKDIETTLNVYSHVSTDLTAAAQGLPDWLNDPRPSLNTTTSGRMMGS